MDTINHEVKIFQEMDNMMDTGNENPRTIRIPRRNTNREVTSESGHHNQWARDGHISTGSTQGYHRTRWQTWSHVILGPGNDTAMVERHRHNRDTDTTAQSGGRRHNSGWSMRSPLKKWHGLSRGNSMKVHDTRERPTTDNGTAIILDTADRHVGSHIYDITQQCDKMLPMEDLTIWTPVTQGQREGYADTLILYAWREERWSNGVHIQDGIQSTFQQHHGPQPRPKRTLPHENHWWIHRHPVQIHSDPYWIHEYCILGSAEELSGYRTTKWWWHWTWLSNMSTNSECITTLGELGELGLQFSSQKNSSINQHTFKSTGNEAWKAIRPEGEYGRCKSPRDIHWMTTYVQWMRIT